MVQSVVHRVVSHVEEERSADDAIGDVSREDGVGEACEGEGEGGKEEWGHDEAETVHLWEGASSACVESRSGGENLREGSGGSREEESGG